MIGSDSDDSETDEGAGFLGGRREEAQPGRAARALAIARSALRLRRGGDAAGDCLPTTAPPASAAQAAGSAAQAPPSGALNLRVRLTAGGGEASVAVQWSDNVAKLKREVLAAVGPAPAGSGPRHCRLIAGGRMLQPDAAALSTFRLAENQFIHAVFSAAPPRNTAGTGPNAPPPPPRPVEPPSQRRGFDRLLDASRSTDDIALLRLYFTPSVTAHARTMAARDGESSWDRTRRAEDAWMALQGEASEFHQNVRRRAEPAGGDGTNAAAERALLQSWSMTMAANGDAETAGAGGEDEVLLGSSRDFAWGFLMGFFLGFIMLFWLWDRSVSYRHKMGILAGVSCQLMLKIVNDREEPLVETGPVVLPPTTRRLRGAAAEKVPGYFGD